MERQWELAGGGTLCCQEAGERVALRADCPADGAGLYKVWLHSGGNGRFLLGTLTPEGGRLCLRRTVTRAELERRHCWPVTGGERVLAFAFSGQAGPWRRASAHQRSGAAELFDGRPGAAVPPYGRRVSDGPVSG